MLAEQKQIGYFQTVITIRGSLDYGATLRQGRMAMKKSIREEQAMPFVSQRAKLNLSVEEIKKLDRIIVRARTESTARTERAKMLLAYHQNETIYSMAAALKTYRHKMERGISKALDCGV